MQRCLHHIMRIMRPKAFRQNIRDPSGFKHSPNRTTSNKSGTFRGRLKHYFTGTIGSNHIMWNRRKRQ